jgi:hypothetical protein
MGVIHLTHNDINEMVRKAVRSILSETVQEVMGSSMVDKEDIIQTDDNIVYQITTTDNQKNNEYQNISKITFQECEDYLKTIYNISKNDTLLIFKYDYNLSGI